MGWKDEDVDIRHVSWKDLGFHQFLEENTAQVHVATSFCRGFLQHMPISPGTHDLL